VGLLAEPTAGAKTAYLPSSSVWPLLVYNPLSWKRDDVVTIQPPSPDLKITRITYAATNQAVPFDIDEDGRAVFIARSIPAVGYTTFNVETAPGKMGSTLRDVVRANGAENKFFHVRMTPDGDIQSIVKQQTGREIVNSRGELPFNHLLRVAGQEPAAVVNPLPPEVSVKKGAQMTRITVARARSPFPLTTITLYNDLDRLELHNEIDTQRLPFAGGESWHDSYYFSFPFALSANGLRVMRGGQKWFDRLPDDYLPGARRDSVTTQHLIGMNDGNASVLLAHRQAFHFIFPSYVKAVPSPPGAPASFPAMFTGSWPLREATLYSRAFRRGDQADTRDAGVINIGTVEPGFGPIYKFDYAIDTQNGSFDDVAAWRFGSSFNVPLLASYVGMLPSAAEKSFFELDQPNVELVTVKPFSDTIINGEVSSVPLNPRSEQVFTVRLQEFAGKAATVRIKTPVPISKAEVVNLTEDRVLQPVETVAPLTIAIKPYQTLTIKIELAAVKQEGARIGGK
jgi:hypothetical protein